MPQEPGVGLEYLPLPVQQCQACGRKNHWRHQDVAMPLWPMVGQGKHYRDYCPRCYRGIRRP